MPKNDRVKCDVCDRKFPMEDLNTGVDREGGSGFLACDSCKKRTDRDYPGETDWS